MANTTEDEEKLIILTPKCDSIAYDTYHSWYGNGFSDEVARKKSKEAKESCETELKKDKELAEMDNSLAN